MAKWRVLIAVTPMIVLTACAVQPPTGVASPSVAETPVVTPVSSPVVTPLATPSMSVQPPTVLPAPEPMVLGPTSLGQVQFGASEKDGVAALKARLGDPDDVLKAPYCELDPQSPYSSTYSYGGLSVLFLAKDTKSTSPRTLKGWSYALSAGLNDAFELDGGLPADPTFAQLQQQYPKGKLVKSELGTVFTLPNKIRFVGSEEPELVQAGPFTSCE